MANSPHNMEHWSSQSKTGKVWVVSYKAGGPVQAGRLQGASGRRRPQSVPSHGHGAGDKDQALAESRQSLNLARTLVPILDVFCLFF